MLLKSADRNIVHKTNTRFSPLPFDVSFSGFAILNLGQESGTSLITADQFKLFVYRLFSKKKCGKMADDVAESPQNRTRFLVINADDFGYCDQRNRGIVESFKNGVVSSASLLANADRAVEAVQLSEEYGIPLGLHLNLTEGRPIQTPNNSLTSEKGLMRGKFKFREALKNGEIDLDDVCIKNTP